MAVTFTNRAKYMYATGAIVPGTTDLRMGLLKTLASHANVPDLNFVSEMESHADFAELTAGGYARVALAAEAATEDDTNDRANIDSNDVAFGALTAGETIIGAFIFKEGASDAARELLSIHDLASTPTNGGTITVTVTDFHRIA